jgi:hypothetical protein
MKKGSIRIEPFNIQIKPELTFATRSLFGFGRLSGFGRCCATSFRWH